MELIKKTIKRSVVTGLTTICTGCTGSCKYMTSYDGYFVKYGCTKYVVKPDLNAVYHIKIGLNSKINDIGFFDADTSSTSQPLTNPNPLLEITGTSNSKLAQLRKYTITTGFTKQYFSGGTINVNGVDMVNSNPLDKIIYYIEGIKYIDIMSGDTSGTTYNIYTPSGYTDQNFINVPIYKNPNKENIVDNPKINNDVFINRQSLSAFDGNYKLEYIKKLGDLITYAGGNYFTIINNS